MSALGEKLFDALDPKLPIYAVLDGARDSRIQSWAVASRAPCWCLYAGQVSQTLQEAAPWLLRLGRGHAYTEEFFADGFADNWGILLASEAPQRDLRRHLRRFLLARDEEGKKLLFRYYDPRVLRSYLPTCNAEELRLFFGPIKAFATNDLEPETFRIFKRRAGELDVRRTRVTPSPIEAEGASLKSAAR